MPIGSRRAPSAYLRTFSGNARSRHLGVSNVGTNLVEEPPCIAPSCACACNVIGEADDSLVDMCMKRGVAFVPSVSARWLHAVPVRLVHRARRPGRRAVPAIYVNWLLGRSPNIPHPPARPPSPICVENLAAAALVLNRQSLTQLDHLARTP